MELACGGEAALLDARVGGAVPGLWAARIGHGLHAMVRSARVEAADAVAVAAVGAMFDGTGVTITEPAMVATVSLAFSVGTSHI